MTPDLKHTLNLPQTAFPMRGNLVQREPARIAHWEQLDLYRKIQAKNAAGPGFILHDGPPFTNGDLHLGHALNKTLKDIKKSKDKIKKRYRLAVKRHNELTFDKV